MKKTRLAAAIVALGSLAAIARTADAQQTTIPSPFHAGQWGIEGYAYAGGGVSRFFTPLTAMVLAITGSHDGMKGDNSPTTTGYKSANSSLALSLALRHHTMLAPKIASTFGAGLGYSVSSQHQEYAGSPSATTSYRSSSVGAFVQAGGQYMLADHFAVGLGYQVDVAHTSARAITELHGFRFSSAFVPLRATLYF